MRSSPGAGDPGIGDDPTGLLEAWPALVCHAVILAPRVLGVNENITIIPVRPPTDAAALPLLLTTEEAAAVLRLAPKTLRNWCGGWTLHRRGPEPVKRGGRRVYRRDDVLACAGIEVAA